MFKLLAIFVAINGLVATAAKLFFLPLLIKADKGDVGAKGKHSFTTFNAFFINMHRVLYGGGANFALFGYKAENGTATNAFAKFHLIHANGNKVAARIVERHGNVAYLINPFQQVAAKEKAVVVQVFG